MSGSGLDRMLERGFSEALAERARREELGGVVGFVDAPLRDVAVEGLSGDELLPALLRCERERQLFRELWGARNPQLETAVAWLLQASGVDDTALEAAVAAERRRLDALPYGEYLLTDEWQVVRRYALARSGGRRCEHGFGGHSGLVDVHHRTYERRGWELLVDVVVLCKRCHELVHGKTEGGNR